MVVSWTYYLRSEVQVSRSIEKKVHLSKDKDGGKGHHYCTIGMQNDWERMVILITIILVVSTWCYRLA